MLLFLIYLGVISVIVFLATAPLWVGEVIHPFMYKVFGWPYIEVRGERFFICNIDTPVIDVDYYTFYLHVNSEGEVYAKRSYADSEVELFGITHEELIEKLNLTK